MQASLLSSDLFKLDCFIKVLNQRESDSCGNSNGIVGMGLLKTKCLPVGGCDVAVREVCIRESRKQPPPQNVHECRLPVFLCLKLMHEFMKRHSGFMILRCVTDVAYGRELIRIVSGSVLPHMDVMHPGLVPVVKLMSADDALVTEFSKTICFDIFFLIHTSPLVLNAFDVGISDLLDIESCYLDFEISTFRKAVDDFIYPEDVMVNLRLD